jgi:hypothetical protein
VAFSVATTSSAASSLSTALTAVTGSGAVSAFQNAGLTACTSIVVSTPSSGTTTPVDATSSLPAVTNVCNTASCSGCTSCAAAQACANTYFCSSNFYVANFQCSTLNGLGSWTASCSAGPPSASSSSPFKPAAGLIAAAVFTSYL